MLGHRLLVAAQPRQGPIARALRVGHGFERGERFRRHDEKRFTRIEVARGLDEIRAIDVRDEAKRQLACAVMPERLVGHHRPEIGTANADVDDAFDGLAGVPFPFAAAYAVAELGHLLEHGMHLGHDVLSIHQNAGALGRAQSHVQHGAILGDVDFLAAEHGFDPPTQVTFLGQLEQQLEGLVGDAVLRVI